MCASVLKHRSPRSLRFALVSVAVIASVAAFVVIVYWSSSLFRGTTSLRVNIVASDCVSGTGQCSFTLSTLGNASGYTTGSGTINFNEHEYPLQCAQVELRTGSDSSLSCSFNSTGSSIGMHYTGAVLISNGSSATYAGDFT